MSHALRPGATWTVYLTPHPSSCNSRRRSCPHQAATPGPGVAFSPCHIQQIGAVSYNGLPATPIAPASGESLPGGHRWGQSRAMTLSLSWAGPHDALPAPQDCISPRCSALPLCPTSWPHLCGFAGVIRLPWRAPCLKHLCQWPCALPR